MSESNQNGNGINGVAHALAVSQEDKARLTLFEYDSANYTEKQLDNIEQGYESFHKKAVTWLNIDGIEDVEIIQKLAEHCNIHHLIVEDIVITNQRPKMDDCGEYLFILLQMLTVDKKTKELVSEQVSFVVGRDYVISFQETAGGDVFDGIRERIRKNKGRIRKMGADYLAYVLIDCIVDNYFVILDNAEVKIEKLEEGIVKET
ncbi:MAG: magnesium and cobalt transport protein CorA, partial [Candidatus Omnitrophica bacterium]|nr:magnesium and cobalt transport protein CorA [Candidatus Omnitrophota bacterium]